MESTELEKYLKLADIAYDGKNGAEAYEYASKALEIDMTCAQAWYMKMLAIGPDFITFLRHHIAQIENQ